jgi:hypothetical protein
MNSLVCESSRMYVVIFSLQGVASLPKRPASAPPFYRPEKRGVHVNPPRLLGPLAPNPPPSLLAQLPPATAVPTRSTLLSGPLRLLEPADDFEVFILPRS